MLVSEIITDCQARINDTGMNEIQPSEWLKYINQACDKIGRQLITNLDFDMIAPEITVNNGDAVPLMFEKTVGNYPGLYTEDSKFKISGAGTAMKVRYWAMKSHVTDVNSTMPFKDSVLSELAQQAAIFAGIRVPMDMKAEQGLLNEQVAVLNSSKAK